MLLCLCFLMTSCSPVVEENTLQKIAAPSNNMIPVQGTWKVESYMTPKDTNSLSEVAKKYVGKIVVFSAEMSAFDNEVIKNPKYKIKTVLANDYLVYQYKTSPASLGIKKKQIDVISVFNPNNNLFYNFMQTSEDRLVTNVDGVFLFLHRISSDASFDSHATKDTNNESANQLALEDSNLRSGVLLGLRTEKSVNYSIPGATEKEQVEYAYRTLWISSTDRVLSDVYETKDLFVPRKTGFWKLGVTREIQPDYARDMIFAHPVETKPLVKAEPWNKGKGFISKKILFIGNDYVSTEWNGGGHLTQQNSSWRTDELKILPMDNVSSPSGMKISEMLGVDSKDVLQQSSVATLNSVKPDLASVLENSASESNIGIVRKNGHWSLRGRLNSTKVLANPVYLDFNVTTPLSSKVVNYDDLKLPWSSVKNMNPDATDAYTSPNRDLALIIANNTLYIYTMTNGELSSIPAGKVQLNDDECVVMAEWVRGEYVEKWNKSFNKNDVRKLEK